MVTDDAAGAAELLTVVLLLVVSAFEIIALHSRTNANAATGKCLIIFRGEALDTIKIFLSL